MLARSLVACALMGEMFAPAQTPPAPGLTPADAARIETRLESDPDDPAARTNLLRYYFRAGASDAERVRPLRRKHIVWMIERHPDAPVLAESAGTIDPAGHALADSAGYADAATAWRKHFSAKAPAPPVFGNAINFFKTSDPPYAQKLAADALAAYPGDARIALAKGGLNALVILGAKLLDGFGAVLAYDVAVAQSDAAREARRELETTSNPNIVGGAARVLARQLQALPTQRRETQLPEIASLAERCFTRAMELDRAGLQWSAGLSSLYQTSAVMKRDPADKIDLLEKAVRVPGSERNRWGLLADLGEAQFALGAFDKASASASELLALAPKYDKDWFYGNAIHKGNILLGRIALKRGNVAEAGKRLIAAGGTPGSPQLDSFGPDWQLAQDLLAKGEQAAVSQYIDLCRKFWKLDRGRLDAWTKTLAAGGSPNFFGPPEFKAVQLIGKPAPDFRLPDLHGKTVALADFKGKIVLLDFWATWCAPCRQEMPDFEKLHREFADKDVAILAIDVGEAQAVVAPYIEKEKYTFPVLLAEGSDVPDRYGVNAYPTLVAVDPAGRVAAYLVGNRPASGLRDAIALARAGAPSAAGPALPAPRQLSPEPAAVFDHFPRQTTLVWSAVPDAAGYMVEVDYYAAGAWDSEKREKPAAFRVTEPVYSFKFYGAQPGRWRVWAVDAAGRESAKTEWREFRFTK